MTSWAVTCEQAVFTVKMWEVKKKVRYGLEELEEQFDTICSSNSFKPYIHFF